MALAGTIARVVPLAVLAWIAKASVIFGADAEADVIFWGSFALSVVLACACVSSLIRCARAGGSFATALAFTVAFGAPFFLDIRAAVSSEAPGKAVPFAIAGFAAGAILLGSWRAFALRGLLALETRATRPAANRAAANHAGGAMFRYLLFSLSEAAVLAWSPLLFFSHVPIPVPAARSWENGRATLVPPSARAETRLVVFVDPDSDDARRTELSVLASSYPTAFAALVAERVGRELDAGGAGGRWGRVVLVFPETFLQLAPASFRASWPALAEAFAPRAESGASRVEIALGARDGDANVLYRGFLDDRLGQARGGVAASKESFVPFFEVPVLGVSVRDSDVSRALAFDDDERLGPVRSGSGLEFGSASTPALVCYEALAPWRWPLGGKVLVLTNHRPFSRPGTASRTYDLALRQIARATGASVMLAANRGSAGVFGAIDAHGLAYVVARPAGGL